MPDPALCCAGALWSQNRELLPPGHSSSSATGYPPSPRMGSSSLALHYPRRLEVQSCPFPLHAHTVQSTVHIRERPHTHTLLSSTKVLTLQSVVPPADLPKPFCAVTGWQLRDPRIAHPSFLCAPSNFK